jgi:protein TonB
MTRDVNLTSQAWCDLIFAGKNRYYGAYEIRRKSSGRHLNALLIVVAAIVAVLFAVKVYGKINASGDASSAGMETPVTMSVIDLSIPKPENRVVMEPPQEAVKLKAAIRYTEYRVDNTATDDDEPVTMDDLNASTDIIFTDNIAGSADPDAIDPHSVPPKSIVPEIFREPAIRDFAEIMPHYPEDLTRYLAENLRYPVADMENGTHGRVLIRFVVNVDGSIGNVEVLRSLSPGCDREAVRVIKSMKKWIPGRQNGVAVAVYFALPVRFALAN